ncbi:MAG: Hsp20/alpha crystallin family protein [Candidatus Bathyarchaeota archaeon BA2]|nr:MAG: Hsp20/alpha crystallin family protein [Candidatus Bathyarchaeota archaeon BA2]
MWLTCRATLGRGKNKLLVRGTEGVEWVFCPAIKSIKRDRVSTARCQGCKHFIRFEQTYIFQTHTTRKTLSFGTTTTSKGTCHIAKPSSRSRTTYPHATPLPHVPNLIKEREPLIDIFEEEDHLIILAELPSVNEKDVNIKTEENTLTISAFTATKKYLRIIKLPVPVKKDTIKFTYRNNILQVRLEKL